jgi:hypothetical protein
MRFITALSLAAGLPLGVAGALMGGQPWEISTAGGYLNGNTVVQSASRAEQFRKPPEKGVRPFLAYDKEGKSNLVGRGEARLWEFVSRGPNTFYIRAAEGKWKGYYLRTSDRAFKDGRLVSHLLELSKEPQTFEAYQVAK